MQDRVIGYRKGEYKWGTAWLSKNQKEKETPERTMTESDEPRMTSDGNLVEAISPRILQPFADSSEKGS
jgi:hypothetical protein